MEPTPPAYTASAAPSSSAAADSGAPRDAGTTEPHPAAAPAYDGAAPACDGDSTCTRFHIQADDIALGYRRQVVVAAGGGAAPLFAAKHHGQHAAVAVGAAAAADAVTLYAGAGPGRSSGADDDAPVLAAARLHTALAAGFGSVRVFAAGAARVRVDARAGAYAWRAGGRRWTWRAGAHAPAETARGWVLGAADDADADADAGAGVLARLRGRVRAPPPLRRARCLTAALSVEGEGGGAAAVVVGRFAELLPRAAARPSAPPVYDGGHAGTLEFAPALARADLLAALCVLLLVLERRRRRALGRQGGFRDAFGAGWYLTG